MPSFKFDERDIMFSRGELKPGTQPFEEYYKKHPEKKPLDDIFRKLPGILSPAASEADRVMFVSADANFIACDNLHNLVDGPVADKKETFLPEEITRYIKQWIKNLGAPSVGITQIKDHHIYQTGGRRERYGVPVHLDHPYAIVFTVEMDHTMVKQAPKASSIMESAQQYLHAGTIAVQVALFLRLLGYSARAHIDANYHVICPTIAKDAGLGEIGRMGILITPQLGPRVRLGVVTTDLPLIVDRETDDNTVINFCKHCKKCAVACPAQAISFDDRKEDGGFLRWKINHEKCYTFWCTTGTDCARCMAVCPYAHPDNAFHNFVRFLVKHSSLFRRYGAFLDDIFYRKKPNPAPFEDWQKVQ